MRRKKKIKFSTAFESEANSYTHEYLEQTSSYFLEDVEPLQLSVQLGDMSEEVLKAYNGKDPMDIEDQNYDVSAF